MNEDTELLNYIYKNAKMGVIGIDNIKDSIEDDKLLKVIMEQQNDYYQICVRALKMLSLSNTERKNITGIAKMMTYIDAKMKLMRDSSSSNIAKMMIDGNNMGITEITEKINHYQGSDKDIIALAKELLKIEQKNLDNLKKYL